MELSFTAAHDRFRDDVREFFDTRAHRRTARRAPLHDERLLRLRHRHEMAADSARQGLARAELAGRIRRHRLDADAALHLQLRTRARESAAGVADGARDARPCAARLRHAGTARLLPAAHAARRRLLVSGLFRTAGRLRSRAACRPPRSPTATTTSSTAPRSGPRTRTTRTACSVSCAPATSSGRRRASRFCCST